MSSLGIAANSNEIWKSSDLIEKKLGSSLDRKIASSTKQVLLDRIEFKEASKPDPFYQELKKKYTPLNSVSMKQQSNGHVVKNISKRNVKSELNGKLGKDELPAPKFVLFDKDKVQLQWKTVRNVGPGLFNLGNTCFLNSVIQVLTYTPPLVNYLATQEHSNKCVQVGFCMLCELQRHVSRTFSHNQNQAIKPMAILQKLKFIAKHLRFGQQEDSHEFLRYVIDGMTKSCLAGISEKLDLYTMSTTVVHQIFGGYYRSQVTCEKCRHTSNTFDPLMEVLLDIKNAHSLHNALHKLVSVELLKGDNMYLCPRCKQKVPAKKHVQIHKPPNVLTMCLKRFDSHSLFASKINKDISYPEKLNVRPFLSEKQGPPVNYLLFAVLVHSGYSCNSGHYYCFIKAANKQWYQMNDASVRQVSLKSVLAQQAYLLFYVKDSNVAKEKNGEFSQQPTRNIVLNGNKPAVSTPLKLFEHHTPKVISEPRRKLQPSSESCTASKTEIHSGHRPFASHPTSIPKQRDKITFALNQNTSKKRQNSPQSGDVAIHKSNDLEDENSPYDSNEKKKKEGTGETVTNLQVNEISSSVDENRKSECGVKRDTCISPDIISKESGKVPSEVIATTKWTVSKRMNHPDKCESLSSEVSNPGSVASKTGEWSVRERNMTQEYGPKLPARQHAGWDVSSCESVTDKKAGNCVNESEQQCDGKIGKPSLEVQVNSQGGSREYDLKTRLLSGDEFDEERKRGRRKRLKKLQRNREEKNDQESSDDVESRERRKKHKRNKRKKKHKKKKKSSDDEEKANENVNTTREEFSHSDRDSHQMSNKKTSSKHSDHSHKDLRQRTLRDNEKPRSNEDIRTSRERTELKTYNHDRIKPRRLHRCSDDIREDEKLRDDSGHNSKMIFDKGKQILGKVTVSGTKDKNEKRRLVPYSVDSTDYSNQRGRSEQKGTLKDKRDSSLSRNYTKSNEKRNVIDTLLLDSKKSSNYGRSVKTWEERSDSAREEKYNEEIKKRRRDIWDEEYDKGKVKRTKTSSREQNHSYRGENCFQREYDRRRLTISGLHSSASNGWHQRHHDRHSWRERR